MYETQFLKNIFAKPLIVLVLILANLYGCSKLRSEAGSINNGHTLSEDVKVNVIVQKELFPVIAKTIAQGNQQLNLPNLIKWEILNEDSDPVNLTIISEISGWTPPTISNVVVKGNETKEFMQTPFGEKLLENKTLNPATLTLKAKLGEKVIFEETKNLNIRSVDDMVLSNSLAWDTESMVAAWVTPNDPEVEHILSLSKIRRFEKKLSGYQQANSNDVISQARAIFNAVRNYGVSYVSSTVSFGQVGFAQRVRLPRESIESKSANCIDGAVLFASLFENIGLEPVIILIPGHAFVGVRLSQGSNQVLFIETTIVGRNIWNSLLTLTTTFDAAVKEGNKKYSEAINNSPSSVRIIDIKTARAKGVFPLI